MANTMTKEVRAQLDTICRIILDTVEAEKIYLFGSYAYGTPNKDSDFDIYVVIPDGSANPFDVMTNIRVAIPNNFGMPLDIIADYASRFNWYKDKPTLQRKMIREGVLLYDRNQQGVA